jgi:hypothetical protein
MLKNALNIRRINKPTFTASLFNLSLQALLHRYCIPMLIMKKEGNAFIGTVLALDAQLLMVLGVETNILNKQK